MTQISDTERTQRLEAARAKVGRPGLRLLGACFPRVVAPLADAVRTFGKATVLAGSVFAGSAALPSSQAHAIDLGHVVGALVGGFAGSNVGSGTGREIATAAGAGLGAWLLGGGPSRAEVPVYREPSAMPAPSHSRTSRSLGIPVHRQYGPMVDAYAMKDGSSGSQHWLMQCVVWKEASTMECTRQGFSTARSRDTAAERMNQVYDQRFGRLR